MKARAIILISGSASKSPAELVETTLKPFSLTILDRQSILMAGRLVMALEVELDPAHIEAIQIDLERVLDDLDVACDLV